MIARSTFDFDELVRDVGESVPVILPSATIEWRGEALVLRRGIAAARFEHSAPGQARITFLRGNVVEIDARFTILPAGADDVIADVVGYLIGASVGSLSLYPFHGPKPVLKTRARSRRTSNWDRERMTARARSAAEPQLALVGEA